MRWDVVNGSVFKWSERSLDRAPLHSAYTKRRVGTRLCTEPEHAHPYPFRTDSTALLAGEGVPTLQGRRAVRRSPYNKSVPVECVRGFCSEFVTAVGIRAGGPAYRRRFEPSRVPRSSSAWAGSSLMMQQSQYPGLLPQLRRKPAIDRRPHFGHQAIALSESGGLDRIVKLHRHRRCPWTNRKPPLRHDGFGA